MTISASQRKSVHVVHLTTVHKPFDVRIFHKECKSLAAAGYKVSLIQSDCNSTNVDAVDIVPIPRRRHRISRMTLGVADAVITAMRLRANIVHFHDVELIWGAVVLKMLGKKVIYDVHEDVVKDLHDKSYLPRWTRLPIRLCIVGFEFIAQRVFDQIVSATPSLNARFPEGRSTLIRNSPILGEFSDMKGPPFASRGNCAVYLGGLASFNGPVAMVDAMALLEEPFNAKLILGGHFPDLTVESRVHASPGWPRVEFHGWVQRSDIGALFAKARCGLVVYRPTPNVVDSEPNKFFELMSAGLPLIVSDFPVWKELIRQFECGIVVNPDDTQAIANAMRYFFDNPHVGEEMGQRGRQAVLDGYNWSVDSERLVRLYDGISASLNHA